MANSKSAKKRIRVNERNRLENRVYKGNVKSTIKNYLDQLKNYQKSQNSEDKQKAQEILQIAYSRIDKAVKKNIFHKNKAARKKSQLSKALNSL
jgi:small subunit ribosomal protein S20|tara:strand:- start:555 stop:836 length:282 start_codon:yes stop_codon:yes gene_type:complete